METRPDASNALRRIRALIYEDLDQSRRNPSELEKLYADAPDYENVAGKLIL